MTIGDRGRWRKVRPLLTRATLKIYPGYPHGMMTTHADVINPDLLKFITG